MNSFEKICREAIRERVARFNVEPLFREQIAQMQLTVPARVAARMLGVGLRTFRKLGLPIVSISQKTYFYRVSDLREFIENRTSKGVK